MEGLGKACKGDGRGSGDASEGREGPTGDDCKRPTTRQQIMWNSFQGTTTKTLARHTYDAYDVYDMRCFSNVLLHMGALLEVEPMSDNV